MTVNNPIRGNTVLSQLPKTFPDHGTQCQYKTSPRNLPTLSPTRWTPTESGGGNEVPPQLPKMWMWAWYKRETPQDICAPSSQCGHRRRLNACIYRSLFPSPILPVGRGGHVAKFRFAFSPNPRATIVHGHQVLASSGSTTSWSTARRSSRGCSTETCNGPSQKCHGLRV